MQRNTGIFIRDKEGERLRELPTPSVVEKATTLMTRLGREYPQPGATVRIDCQRLSTDLSLTERVRSGSGDYSENFVATEAAKWMGVSICPFLEAASAPSSYIRINLQ